MNSTESIPDLTVIEFFSGIGGWAESLEQLYLLSGKSSDTPKPSCSIVLAIDINDAANQVYSHNFPQTKVLCKTIGSLSVQYIDSLLANCWCMSPPCQPFTRNNTSENRDDNDNRTDALFALLSILQQSICPPTYICLENVVGFEDSNCCHHLITVLKRLNYSYDEYILTPSQFGIPNERPRYYLTAIRQTNHTDVTPPPLPLLLSSSLSSSSSLSIPSSSSSIPTSSSSSSSSSSIMSSERCMITSVSEEYKAHSNRKSTIGDYLDATLLNGNPQMEPLWVPDKLLNKSASWCFDICTSSDTTSACFTKSYARFIRGTGSVLYVPDDKNNNNNNDDDDDDDDAFLKHHRSKFADVSSHNNNNNNNTSNSFNNNHNNDNTMMINDDGNHCITSNDNNNTNTLLNAPQEGENSIFRRTPYERRKYNADRCMQIELKNKNDNLHHQQQQSEHDHDSSVECSYRNSNSSNANDNDNSCSNMNSINNNSSNNGTNDNINSNNNSNKNHNSSYSNNNNNINDTNTNTNTNNTQSVTHDVNINNRRIKGGKLRFFAPCELIRLFGFSPGRYTLPAHSVVSVKKCYELIGNSLNVTMTKYVILQMLNKACSSSSSSSNNNNSSSSGSSSSNSNHSSSSSSSSSGSSSSSNNHSNSSSSSSSSNNNNSSNINQTNT